jgi:hypothetical protein
MLELHILSLVLSELLTSFTCPVRNLYDFHFSRFSLVLLDLLTIFICPARSPFVFSFPVRTLYVVTHIFYCDILDVCVVVNVGTKSIMHCT